MLITCELLQAREGPTLVTSFTATRFMRTPVKRGMRPPFCLTAACCHRSLVYDSKRNRYCIGLECADLLIFFCESGSLCYGGDQISAGSKSTHEPPSSCQAPRRGLQEECRCVRPTPRCQRWACVLCNHHPRRHCHPSHPTPRAYGGGHP